MRTRWIDESRLAIQGDWATARREDPAPSSTVPTQQGGDAAPRFDSKLEAAYFQHLEALRFCGEIVRFWYHPFSINLPGGLRYRPDFLIHYRRLDQPLEIHETKGWSKNLRDGMTRFKLASGLFPCFGWRLVKRIKGQWDVRTV